MDYRNEIVKRLESSLVTELDSNDISEVSNRLLIILNEYEVQERCTEIAIVETPNEQILKRYCASLIIEGKSKKTVDQYARVCVKLSEFLNKPFTEATSYDIKTYLALEKQKNNSNRTLENKRSYFSAFFTWMENEELIEKSPMRTIKPIKCKREIKVPFSRVEIDVLKNNCETLKERALIEVLISSGVRVSELVDANIEDIDFNSLVFHVKHGKGDKERITYLTDVSANHLKAYLDSRNDSCEALFVTKYRERYTTNAIRDMLNRIASRVVIENVHPHRFRRTFATDLAGRGMDIQEIQRLMGHSDINTTLHYIYTRDEKVKESYRKFA